MLIHEQFCLDEHFRADTKTFFAIFSDYYPRAIV